MLHWLRKSAGKDRVGIGFCHDGVALVRLSKDADGMPQLTECLWETALGDNRLPVLEKLLDDERFQGSPCYMSLEHQAYQLLQIETPDVPEAELADALRWRIQDLIDYPVEEALLDSFPQPPSRQATTFAVAARIDQLRPRVDAVTSAGLELCAIDIPELALRNLSSLFPEDEHGLAFLHLVGRQGLVMLVREQTLYLARGLELPQSDPFSAFDAPDTSGLSLEPRDDDLPLVEQDPVADALALEVQRSLDFYESNFNNTPISGMVMAPVEGEHPGLPSKLSQILGQPVRELDITAVLNYPETLSDEQQARCLPAIGAALRNWEAA